MADLTQNAPGSIWGSVSNFFAAIWTGLTTSAAMNARVHRIEALAAKSDEELAEMGLRREDITAYVFRDLMYT